MKQVIGHVLFPAIFVVIWAIFFYPTIVSGKLPVPTDTLIGLYHPWRDLYAPMYPRGVPYKNFLITDPIRQQIPWKKLVVDSFKQGNIPSWNPYSFSGTPLLGNIQAGALYPLNVIFLILPFQVAWTVSIMVQPLLGGLFLYLFLKRKNIHPCAALLGAIAWSFGGFFVSWLTWGTIDQTALWLPLILLLIDTIADAEGKKTKILWSTVLAVSLTVAFFAGHAQVAFYIFVFAVIYSVRKKSWWLSVAALTAVLVSSVQWVPFLQLLGHSGRVSDAAAWLKDGWFLPWQHLAQFIAPDFFGNPATLNYWGIWNYGEFIGYVGILPLICAFYAVVVRKDRVTRFFAVSLGIVLLFMLPNTIAKIPFELQIPIISSMQPTRLMVVVDFCLAVLAALGMDHFLRNRNKKIFYGIGILCCLLAGMWAYVIFVPKFISNLDFSADLLITKRNLVLPSLLFFVSSCVLVSAIYLKKQYIYGVCGFAIVIVSLDLLRFGWKFTPFTPPEYFFPETAAVSFLQSQQKPFRVMSLDNRVLPPNTTAYYGIESVEGYDPVYDARYEEFIAALNRQKPDITPPFGFNRIIVVSTVASPLLPLLNVTYVLSLDTVKDSGLELMYQEGRTKIYWYKKALPRIYPVESIIYADSKQHVMDALYHPGFDSARQAVVEEAIPILKSLINATDKIDVVTYGPAEIRVVSNFLSDHFVVIANMYDSGWKASIDSISTRIYRTNYVFQGIVVPKGNHSVVLYYQ